MDLVLKIRGIYATALTRFFLQRGFRVALPSGPIAERFAGWPGFDAFEAPDVQLADLDSKQGILLEGEEGVLETLLSHLRDGFSDTVARKRAEDVMEIEFPFAAKSVLDEVRNSVTPTLRLHHRLKIMASDQVDRVEADALAHAPEMRDSLSLKMERELIWSGYGKSRQIAVEHVKPDGRVLNLSEGEIVETDFAGRRLVLKRSKFKGGSTYDGLGMPKREGDYAVSEVRGGDWFYRHTYFRAGGEKIGDYYNINTPVEFYFDRIRYVDLEVDVVRFPDGRVEAIDERELWRRFEEGHLGAAMRDRALGEASRLSASLAGTPPAGQQVK
jgi:hypothetical protein